MTGRVAMRTVYVRAGRARKLFPRCAVVQVSPLLRELVLRIVDMTERRAGGVAGARIIRVFFDELVAAPQVPLHLPTPADPRLRRITDALRAEPGDPRTLAEWSQVAGASERTIARLFVAQTGATFGQWRQQARLLGALELLALGHSTTRAALDLGYESASAFIVMFRKAMGTTPGRYFQTSAPSASC